MSDTEVREHLVWLVEGGHAHAKFDDAVAKMPKDKVGVRPPGSPHSAWELLEHMRLAQEDILRFSLSADWVSPAWPEGYWPPRPAPEEDSEWDRSIRAFRTDLAEFVKAVREPTRNLYEKFPWGEGQTLMREALLIADHNSYHLGQLVVVRQLLGAWPR